MEIAVINTLPIPSGAASVNRLLSYSKGLVELGNKVTILSTAIGKYNGEIYGIKYKNLSIPIHNRFLTPIILLLSLFRLCIEILVSNYSVIIYVTNSPLLIIPLYIISRIKRIKLIQEKSEYPFVLMRKQNIINKIYAWLYIRIIYSIPDGMILMTNSLVSYFSTKTKCKYGLLRVPMSIDPSRFETVSDSPISGDYIAYCGDFSNNKDGVENLIKAFLQIEQSYSDLKLVLIGSTKDIKSMTRITDLTNNCNKIVFTGMVNRKDIPSYLCGAKILALARPMSLQSEGGFPTKLGEYLATGKPIAVTSVGDIPNYLNNTNSFICPPDNINAFATTLKYILDNYESALNTGAEGKKLCYSVFNYYEQSVLIHKYLLK